MEVVANKDVVVGESGGGRRWLKGRERKKQDCRVEEFGCQRRECANGAGHMHGLALARAKRLGGKRG